MEGIMIIGADCKAIIDSMDIQELLAYTDFLLCEIERHEKAIKVCMADNYNLRTFWRSWNPEMDNYDNAMIKLNQTAIARHRADIKSSRLNIKQAESRMEAL
jgi:hypothetical protein